MGEIQKYGHAGEILRMLREDYHYVQEDIAFVLGMARGTYAKCEAGTRQLTLQQMSRLADFYRISYEELMKAIYQKNTAALRHIRARAFAEKYDQEYQQGMGDPYTFWNNMYSVEHIRMVYYFTKVDPLGQREISEFIQKDAEGFA